MTDNTQPLALMLAEQYDYGDPAAHSNTWKVAVCTELRRQHARIAELKARVQELGAMARENRSRRIVELEAQLEALRAALAASPTTPAEQQATKETSGGFHVWRDISTAPKDGSRFVATGHNYGLYSEVRHACVAQWFRGCWIEASDWNETSELKYLTHWMPLPSPPDDVAAPAEQQAAPKAAPGDALDEVMRERDDAEDFINELLDEVLGADRPEWSSAYNRYDAMSDVRERITALHKPAVDKAWGQFQSAMAAPQQEAQEPYAYAVYFPDQPNVELVHDLDELIDDLTNRPHVVTKLYTAPRPAPDCHHRPPCDECAEFAAQGGK